MVAAVKRHFDAGSPASPSRDKNHTTSSDPQQSLADNISSRFRRITGVDVIVTPVRTTRSERKAALTVWGEHPLCAPHASKVACMRCRLGHLRNPAPTDRPAAHHRCVFDNVCVFMPVMIDDKCVAHCKLALPADAQDATVDRYAELLELLAESANAQAHAGAPTSRARMTPEETQSHDPLRVTGEDGWSEPVYQALEMIATQYTDPDMTVTQVAQRIGLNRDYLSHQFRIQTGRRMSREIFLRRMQHARSLLASTNLQVRQIAITSGFLNTDWFSHTFHELEGITPSEYRRQSQSTKRIEGQ